LVFEATGFVDETEKKRKTAHGFGVGLDWSEGLTNPQVLF